MINGAETSKPEGIAITCKQCGRRFYAVYGITADDVLDIAEHVRQGHIVSKVLPGVTVRGCVCGRIMKA